MGQIAHFPFHPRRRRRWQCINFPRSLPRSLPPAEKLLKIQPKTHFSPLLDAFFTRKSTFSPFRMRRRRGKVKNL